MRLQSSIQVPYNSLIIPSSIIDEFRNFTNQNGFLINDIIADGEIHRFDTSEYKRHDLAGWYVLTIKDGFAFGTIGDWRTGNTISWNQKGIDTSSEKFIKAKKQIDEERKIKTEKEQALAKQKANMIFAEVSQKEVPKDHPYLVRKNISSEGFMCGYDGSNIVIPIFDDKCEIVSLQFINKEEKNNKRFLPFGRMKGCFTLLGDTPKSSDYILLVEGWATGISVHKATGYPVACAFNAGNLDAASKTIKSLFPYNPIVIVADNDINSHTGENYAKKTGLPYVLIPLDPNNPNKSMDANDYVNAGFDLSKLIQSNLPKRLIVSLNEALACRKKSSFFIKNWLPKNAMMTLYGPSGCGKTFLALDWLLHMSSGLEEWQGCKVKKSTVLYLCGEGKYGMLKRVKGWMEYHNISDTGRFFLMDTPLNLSDPLELNTLITAIEQDNIRPDIICIDTFYRYFVGDENKAVDTKPFFESMSKLMNLYDGLSILLIHHTGKADKTQLRGSTSIKAALDVNICCDKNGSVITITQDKMKDYEAREEPLYLEFKNLKIKDENWKDDEGNPENTAVLLPMSKDKAKSELKEQNRKISKDEGDITALTDQEIEAFRSVVMNIARSDPTGKIFINKRDWRKYLKDKGMTPDNIDNYFRSNPNDKLSSYRPIMRLMGNGYIVRYEASTSSYVLGNTNITQDFIREKSVKNV